MNTLRLLPLLSCALLASCTKKAADPTSIQHGNINTLLVLDPSITTLFMEVARQSAPKATTSIAISPGKYCLSYTQAAGSAPLNGRIELTLKNNNQFTWATRYVNGDLVRSELQGGVYRITGQALILHTADDHERVIPITGTTPDAINRWGDLPLSRQGCTDPPLTGDALKTALTQVNTEQHTTFPWKTTPETETTTTTPTLPTPDSQPNSAQTNNAQTP